ncbi:helix-turn-helix domain-containing protein [Roseovarius sp. M141]|uniref:helix-turn-helix domain-containing protein n=1 Tax=Roseovarius sp. M141 TaxID=2583806 RepID=UPI0020CE490E|nr:helix-turn-helix domain-containing protein [Roseovarius sp. M141]MCQ0093854.1 helix-turn-helix domain-containing protein [Roseovarius sp. M141]
MKGGAVGGTTIGTRIRERRLARGVAQGALASQAGISPSYLNLIEHNRRKIGGRILLRLAEALEVDAQTLSQGGEAALIAALREAAGEAAEAGDADTTPTPDLDRAEEFAGRFPGWAQLLADTLRRAQAAGRQVDALSDRLAHDPQLAASLHEVLSVVTAIRSTASILVETPALEPEWRARFHRNLGEDSQRLADGAQRLVRYLDDGPGTGRDILSPQDEVDRFLAAAGHQFDALEQGGDVDAVLATGDMRPGTGAHMLARGALETYCADAAALPQATLLRAVARHGLAPLALAQEVGVPLPRLMRRLAAMPEDAVGPVGLISADASGAIGTLKPLEGFAATRLAGACPLWPLFRVAGQPAMPLRQRIVQPDRGAQPVLSIATCEPAAPPAFNMPPLMRSFMLLLPDVAGDGETALMPVGTACRVCPRTDCGARHEPSVLANAGDTDL